MRRLTVSVMLLATSLAAQTTEVKRYPLDSLEGVITRTGVQLDSKISSDGQGSLRLDAKGPTTFRLIETGDPGVEEATLIYQAKVRTENVKGQVYLEMWCVFTGKGEFFSRSLQSPLAGTNDWTTLETPFFLKKGERPSNVKLNVVINGSGRVWIDDLRLVKGSLQ
jgi:hypothetical protein